MVPGNLQADPFINMNTSDNDSSMNLLPQDPAGPTSKRIFLKIKKQT